MTAIGEWWMEWWFGPATLGKWLELGLFIWAMCWLCTWPQRRRLK